MPPMMIAAGIGAVGSIAAGAMSASAQKKAAGKAADAAAKTGAANNALARENREFSAARLDPYAQRGNEAGNAINALLGLGGGQGTQQYGSPQMTEEWANGALNSMGLGSRGDSPGTLRAHLAGQLEGNLSPEMMNAYEGYRSANPQANAMQQGGNNAVQGANNAFQNYLGSTGYQFQVDQGNKAINQGYAANGSLQSGAALKALQLQGQNTATGFFKDYLGLLANQQGVGLSGASAVAGVGQNYVNSVSANNNAMGTAQQNAHLLRGNANAGMWGNVAGAIGGVANAFGSSYRPGG